MAGRQGRAGAALLLAGAAAGAVVALFNYFTPDNGIGGTGGALLVVGSTLVLALVGLPLRRRTALGLLLLAAVLIAGTTFAAWLLEAPTLVAAMAVAACGWLLVAARGGRHA